MRAYSVHSDKTPEQYRSDARANRDAIIQTARRMFLEKGPEIPLKDIAREAGISRSTFYRNFPDRQELIAAVFHFNLDLLERFSMEVAGKPDAFFRLLEAIIQQQVGFQALTPYVTSRHDSLTHRLKSIFQPHVESAIRHGILRSDFRISTDLALLLMMISGALENLDKESRESDARRALQMIREGLSK